MRGGMVTQRAPVNLRPTPAAAPVVRHHAPPAVTREAPPSALLYVVVGVILTDVWRLHDLVPATRVLRPSIVLSLLALAMFLVGGNVYRTLGRLRSPIVVWLAVFFGLVLLGIGFSLDPALSTQTLLSTFLPHVLTGVLVAVSVRSVRDAEFLALGTLVGAAIHTVFVHATATLGPDGRWAELPYYDVNDLALMLVMMIPLTMYFMQRDHSTPRRVFAALCFAFFAYSIVPTGSRGGFIGLALVLAYLLVRYAAIPPRARLVGVLAAVLALAVGGHAYVSRLGTILQPSLDYNWSEETGRLAIWRRGLGYVADRPVLGLGLNQFRTAESRLWPLVRTERMAGRRPPRARGAHNMYLQVAAELGVPALLVFLGLLGTTWRQLTRLRDRHTSSPGGALSGALAASLLGFCVCGVFLHAAFFPVLQMVLGFAVALAATAGGRAYARPPHRGGLFAPSDQARGAAV
jgi:O-antigen ligase